MTFFETLISLKQKNEIERDLEYESFDRADTVAATALGNTEETIAVAATEHNQTMV